MGHTVFTLGEQNKDHITHRLEILAIICLVLRLTLKNNQRDGEVLLKVYRLWNQSGYKKPVLPLTMQQWKKYFGGSVSSSGKRELLSWRSIIAFHYNNAYVRGTWVAQCIKHLTFCFSSDHDHMGCGTPISCSVGNLLEASLLWPLPQLAHVLPPSLY